MRLQALALVLVVTGFGSSIALARNDPAREAVSRATIEVCHRTESGVGMHRLVAVSRSSLERHMRHGDLLAPTGDCSASAHRARTSSTTR